MNAVVRGLTEKQAATAPDSEDRRLTGRTYAIPFEDVWRASVELAGELRGWTLIIANDRAGRIDALARTFFRKTETEVVVSIGLDENAQTRVDLSAKTRTERRDFGRSRRLIGDFVRRLDRKLGASPGQILDPALLPRLQESA